MATDLLLALVAGGLAVLLLAGGRGEPSTHAVVWALALGTTALAAITGGFFHGLRHRLDTQAADRLWRLTLLLSAAVGFFIVAAAAVASGSGSLRIALLLLAGLKFVGVGVIAVRSGRFAVVAYDSGASLLLLGGVVAFGVATGGLDRSGWILAGVVLSLGGAALQLKGVRAGRTFDHNDLFHLVQALACYLFYLGAGQG